MGPKIYMVKRGDTLEKISRELGITANEIREYHNRYCELDFLIGGDKLPRGITEIIIPDNNQESAVQKEKNIENPSFDQRARYRCEQINISNVNGILLHFAEQKHQFLIEQSSSALKAKVKLEEILFNFTPPSLNESFNILTETEFIRNDILFSFSPENGRIEKILNRNELYGKWEIFKETEFWKDQFVRKLKNISGKGINELLQMGEKQFSPNNDLLEEEYRRHLFYFICFDQFLVKSIEEFERAEFSYMSTIVPPITIPVEFRYDKISEENNLLKIRKVGKAILNTDLISNIKNAYDQIHKPNIQYGFTEYKLEFRVRLEFNLKEKLVEAANLYIMESIADNIENTCEYKIKRLHNFTP